jgi:hypothetical protein
MGHPGHASCGLDLVDDPVPVADAFESHGGAFWELREVSLDSSWLVVDTLLLLELPPIVYNGEEGIVFVGIAIYAIMGHGCTSCCLRARGSKPATRIAGGAALAYNQLAGADLASPGLEFGAILALGWPGRLSSRPLGGIND